MSKNSKSFFLKNLIFLFLFFILAQISLRHEAQVDRTIASLVDCSNLFGSTSTDATHETFFINREAFLKGIMRPPEGIPVFSYMAPDQTVVTFVDMARVESGSVFAKAASNFLAKKNRDLMRRVPRYRDDPNGLAKLQATDESVKNRTILVMNTLHRIDQGIPSEDAFLGGGRVVIAESRNDPLPFQIIPDGPRMPEDFWLVQFPRPDERVAEVGALNADTTSNFWRSSEIINACIQILLNLDIKTAFVHTGRIQAELYKKMNIKSKPPAKFNNKNIILQYELHQGWDDHFGRVRPFQLDAG